MPVPPLPFDVTAGRVWGASKVNVIYDHLAWSVDDRPCLLVTSNGLSGDGGVFNYNVLAAVLFSDGSGNFNSTPSINVGGWAAAGDGNEEITVPETGLYEVSIHAQFEDNPDGYRECSMSDNTLAVGPIKITQPAVNGTGTFMSAAGLHFFTAGDLIGMNVYQSSTDLLSCQFTLSAEWKNSSKS